MRGWSRICAAAAAWLGLMTVAAGAVRQTPPAEARGGRLTAVLLLDVTASMTQTSLPLDQRFAQVFNAFAQGLAPGDRAAVGIVAGDTRFGALTTDRRELVASARALLQGGEFGRLGPSPLWDAIDRAGALAADPLGRSAVVLFSDGKSTGNELSLDEVIAGATARRVTVSAVVEGAGTLLLARATSALDPADAIDRLAKATGGRILLDRPPDPRLRNPGPLVALLMEQLHP